MLILDTLDVNVVGCMVTLHTHTYICINTHIYMHTRVCVCLELHLDLDTYTICKRKSLAKKLFRYCPN